MRFTFRRNLTHENRTRFDLGADANDAAVVQIAQHVFADVGNVARDFFRPELCVARFDFQLFDVNRGVVVLFNQLLGNQNRVLKVVTAPGHESDQHVAAEGQFATVRTRTISDYLSL